MSKTEPDMPDIKIAVSRKEVNLLVLALESHAKYCVSTGDIDELLVVASEIRRFRYIRDYDENGRKIEDWNE